MELSFIVNKIKADQQVSDERLERYNFWMLTAEEKSLPDIFGKLLQQLESEENY